MMILLIDDDRQISRLVGRYLEQAGFTVMPAHDLESARRCLDQAVFDLAIVDIMLPDGNGLEMVRRLQADQQLPVIMMTARGGIEDKETAFRYGADDYLVKPFDPNELVLRVQAVLKRVREAETGLKDPLLHRQVIKIGRPDTAVLLIDPDSQTVFLGLQPISMPRREFQILRLLASNPNQTLTREQIVDHIWGLDFEGELRVVDLYIDRLRKRLKLRKDQASDWSIRTVRGLGYRLEVNR